MDKAKFLFALQLTLPVLALWAIVVYGSIPWLAASIVIFLLFRCIGYTLTYHRVITHQTHIMHPVVEFLGLALGFYGSMSTPLAAATLHMNHHKYMDTPRDPHSPKYIGWRAWFPLFWVDKDKGDHKTALRLSKNPRVMFFQKHYWLLMCVPLVLLLISLKAFLFIWVVPAAASLVTLSWSTFNHDNNGPMSRGIIFGILTGGEHHHKWHHNHAMDTSGEGFVDVILGLIAKRRM